MVSIKVVMALVSIGFGVLVIAFPAFLRWLIGAYFVISGILMLLS